MRYALRILTIAIVCVTVGCDQTSPTVPPSTTFTLSTGEEIASPTDDQIRDGLMHLDVDRDGDGFAILERSELTYIQVAGDSKTGFILEYQDGSVSRHFQSERDDYSVYEIVRVFADYRDGKVKWDDVGVFKKITF